MNVERRDILLKRIEAIKDEYTFGNKPKAFGYLTEILKEIIKEQVMLS